MNVVKKYTLGDKTVEIVLEEHPTNPRDEMDTLGTLWCWHRQYQLGSRKEAEEKGLDPSEFSGWTELGEALKKRYKPVVLLPVFMFDHSGVCLSTTSFSDPWDSGQVGFTFATRDVLKEYGYKIATKGVKEKIREVLERELETYSAYVSGDVFGWRLLDAEGEEEDSCWGYYGSGEFPYMLRCALGEEGAKGARESR